MARPSLLILVALLGLAPLSPLAGAAATPQRGLALTFETVNGTDTDAVVAPNVWLHVAGGESPSPFLAPGPFTATWRGSLSAELRSTHTFQAEVNGSLEVVINAREALNVTGEGALSDAGPPMRLNKGPNEIIVTYRPAATGDAHVRLFWKSREARPQLIPQAAFSHLPDDAQLAAARRQRGRELIIEHRCARCHAPDGPGIPELLMNAPEFTGIGSRRNPAWIREWLAKPAAARPDARMPAMFHAGDAPGSAEAVAAFLATLGDPAWSAAPEPPDATAIAAGERLFNELRCSACHQAPGSPPATNTLSLAHVATKFPAGALSRFLGEPTEHFGAIRMPDFRLSEDEAAAIAAFLLSRSKPSAVEAPRPELAPQGRDLVQTTGCLNCHALELGNQFKTKPLAELKVWDGGCLSSTPLEGTRVPHYAFTTEDRRTVREFAEGGFASLRRHVDAEFAVRQVKSLNCAGCHNRQIDQVPSLDLLGGKLKPEYAAKIIGGAVPQKPRPWIAARMPGFITRAEGIARGLANQHGFPAGTPPESTPPDEELVAAGSKLVQANGGFSCVTCHALGRVGAPQAAESAGVNFAWTHERLQRDYFDRWLRDPLAVDPATKMPVFFDASGRSPLNRVLDGDVDRQIKAMWQYFRQAAQ